MEKFIKTIYIEINKILLKFIIYKYIIISNLSISIQFKQNTLNVQIISVKHKHFVSFLKSDMSKESLSIRKALILMQVL